MKSLTHVLLDVYFSLAFLRFSTASDIRAAKHIRVSALQSNGPCFEKTLDFHTNGTTLKHDKQTLDKTALPKAQQHRAFLSLCPKAKCFCGQIAFSLWRTPHCAMQRRGPVFPLKMLFSLQTITAMEAHSQQKNSRGLK